MYPNNYARRVRYPYGALSWLDVVMCVIFSPKRIHLASKKIRVCAQFLAKQMRAMLTLTWALGLYIYNHYWHFQKYISPANKTFVIYKKKNLQEFTIQVPIDLSAIDDIIPFWLKHLVGRWVMRWSSKDSGWNGTMNNSISCKNVLIDLVWKIWVDLQMFKGLFVCKKWSWRRMR